VPRGGGWWSQPTAPPFLSPMGKAHDPSTTRRHSRGLAYSTGVQAKHLLKECAIMRSYICGNLNLKGKAQKPAQRVARGCRRQRHYLRAHMSSFGGNNSRKRLHIAGVTSL